jgi:hypothetical protein
MTTNLTAITSSTSITNNQPSATSRCGLNETGICCKESETPHPRQLARFEPRQHFSQGDRSCHHQLPTSPPPSSQPSRRRP